jgi:hypothetical protein
VVKVQVEMTFRPDGAQLQIESSGAIAAPATASLELPAELAAQLLGVLLNPRSSPMTSRATPPYAEAFSYDSEPIPGGHLIARCVVCGRGLGDDVPTTETEFGGAHVDCWERWQLEEEDD